MRACIVSIADTEEMARTLDRYLHCFLADRIDSYFTTYGQHLLSGSLFRQTDLFILELLRRDDIGYRAEAIPVAEKWSSVGKRVLIISAAVEADIVNNLCYWDLAAPEALYERVQQLLNSPPAADRDFSRLKEVFKEYCRSAVDYHKARP